MTEQNERLPWGIIILAMIAAAMFIGLAMVGQRVDLTDDGKNSLAYAIDHDCYVRPAPDGGDSSEAIQRVVDIAKAGGCNRTVNLVAGLFCISKPIDLRGGDPISLIGAKSEDGAMTSWLGCGAPTAMTLEASHDRADR